MSGLFTLLLLASILCLVVGLVNPNAFVKMLGQNVNRKKIGLVFGIAIIVCFIFIGSFAPDTKSNTNKTATTQQNVQTPSTEKQVEVINSPETPTKEADKPAATETKPATAPTTTPAVTTPATSNTSTSTQSSNNNGYTNVDGNHVESPSSNPAGATARCKDGTYSYSQNHSGTCSHHGGVAEWLD